MTDALETDLTRRIASGDRGAATLLLAHSHSRLRRHLEGRIPRRLQGVIGLDDLMQETQIQVFRHIGAFQPRGPDSFYRWVATIALRRLHNAIKSEFTLKRGQGRINIGGRNSVDDSVVALLEIMAGPEKTPSHHAARLEAYCAVEAGIEQLPEHYRQAVRLVYLEGRTVAETAELMGRTPRAIHNLCHKAKNCLREILGSSTRFLSRSG